MKTLFRIMTLFLTLFCFAGCDDDEEVLATLDVTAANLEWDLEVSGMGTVLPFARRQLLLHYIQLKDKTYKMYAEL